MNKNDIRRQVLLKRKELLKSGNLDIISKKITDKILNSDIFKNAKNIALFYPLKYEIDLLKLLQCKNKNFFFPKCVNNNLEFAKYDGNFKDGPFGTKEPTADSADPKILDIIFVPALCCNNSCYRLGYGKGFYDRFFFQNRLRAKKIIVCANCFITSDFIQDDFDYKCDYILSENGIFE